MAQTNDHLRDLLEKIKGDAERALALLPSEPELHFTHPVTAVVAERCPKCKGESFRAQ